MASFKEYLENDSVELNEVLTSADISTSKGSIGSPDNKQELIDALKNMDDERMKFVVSFLKDNDLLNDIDDDLLTDV